MEKSFACNCHYRHIRIFLLEVRIMKTDNKKETNMLDKEEYELIVEDLVEELRDLENKSTFTIQELLVSTNS